MLHLFCCLGQYVSPLVYIRRFSCLVIDNNNLVSLSYASLIYIAKVYLLVAVFMYKLYLNLFNCVKS